MGNNELSIKKLCVDDVDEIQALFKDIFTKEPWNDDWSDENQLREYMLDLIDGRNPLSIGLFENDTLIGLSLGRIMHWHTGNEYYIYEFCIKTERQGNGYGTEFLRQVTEYVKQTGIQHIFLQTENTVPAYEFYLKNGFHELEGHVSLVKELG